MMSEDKPHYRPTYMLPGRQTFQRGFFHPPSKFSALQSQFISGFLAPTKPNQGGGGGKTPACRSARRGVLMQKSSHSRGGIWEPFDFFVF